MNHEIRNKCIQNQIDGEQLLGEKETRKRKEKKIGSKLLTRYQLSHLWLSSPKSFKQKFTHQYFHHNTDKITLKQFFYFNLF